MLVPNNNPKGYKQDGIFLLPFTFGSCVTIIDCIENIKIYVSDIEESYKDKIIGHLIYSGTEDL